MANGVNADMETVKHRAADAAEKLGDLDRKARALSREHPFLALTGAVLFGFIVGRAASRV